MLLVDKEYEKGFLSLIEENLWEFVMRNNNDEFTAFYNLRDIIRMKNENSRKYVQYWMG